MEVAIIVIIGLAVMAYYGLFRPIERLATMADRAVAEYEREQKVDLVQANANREIDAELVKKAKTNMKLLDSVEL